MMLTYVSIHLRPPTPIAHLTAQALKKQNHHQTRHGASVQEAMWPDTAHWIRTGSGTNCDAHDRHKLASYCSEDGSPQQTDCLFGSILQLPQCKARFIPCAILSIPMQDSLVLHSIRPGRKQKLKAFLGPCLLTLLSLRLLTHFRLV